MTRPARLPLGLAFALAMLVACASPEERFAEHLRRAESYQSEGRTDEALIELQSALKIDPSDPDVNQKLGELLSQRGAYQPAILHFGEAYRLDPTRVYASMRQAALLWRAAPGRAERVIERALREHPDEPIVHRTRSALAVIRGDLDTALSAALHAIELEPENARSWVQLGAVYDASIQQASRNGEQPDDILFEEAIAAYQRVDELYEGGHVGARVKMGGVYSRWPDHRGEATASMRSAIALAKQHDDPLEHALAARSLAEFAMGRNYPRLLVEAIRELVEADSTRVLHWQELATATAKVDGRDAAGAVYAELLERHPEIPTAHVAYTNHLAAAGRYEAAIDHIDEVIAAGSDSASLLEQLLRLQLAHGKAADARATYNEMVDAHAGSVPTRRSAVRLALFEGRDTEALELLRDFVGERESAETERMRAAALMRLGNLPAATAATDRAIALAPSHPLPALRLKARIQQQAEQWPALLGTLRQIEAHAPLNASERLMIVRALYETDEAEAGKAALQDLLGGPVTTPGAALEYSRREGMNDPRQARTHLSKALRYAPGNYEVLEALTRLDLRMDQIERALRRLDRAVESQLAGPRILLMRAELLAHAGQLERAEADALRAFEAAPELAEAVDLLFAIYQAQDRLDEARRSFEEAESVGVLHAGARVLLGRLYLAAGDTQRAREIYEKVVEENPEIAPAKNDLAFMLASDGVDLDRALALAEDAQRELSDNPNAADTVGYVYYRKGSYEAAVQQFRYAIELAEQQAGPTPVYHYHLGLALAGLERHREAADAFEAALAADPDFSAARDTQRALDEARRAAAEADTSPEAGSASPTTG